MKKWHPTFEQEIPDERQAFVVGGSHNGEIWNIAEGANRVEVVERVYHFVGSPAPASIKKEVYRREAMGFGRKRITLYVLEGADLYACFIQNLTALCMLKREANRG